jgi:hypothetical protein
MLTEQKIYQIQLIVLIISVLLSVPKVSGKCFQVLHLPTFSIVEGGGGDM